MVEDFAMSRLRRSRNRVLNVLKANFPNPIDLYSDIFFGNRSDDEFVDIVTSLSDDGLIMYEAFFANRNGRPLFSICAITKKGSAEHASYLLYDAKKLDSRRMLFA